MIPFEPVPFVLLLLLGGVTAVDGTTFGQFMLSRPLVAATLAGWAVGAPMQGATIGLVLEAFHLTVLPVGAARYPEGGPAAVAGGAVYAISSATSGALLITVLLALMLEWIGGESIRYLRRVNSKVLQEEPGSALRTLERRHVTAIGVDFGRGILVVAFGIGIISAAHDFLVPYWGLGDEMSRTLLTAIMVGLFTSAVRLVGWHARFAALGVIAGAVLLLLV